MEPIYFIKFAAQVVTLRPLWGLGHTQTINPRAGFLHDGRAKTVEEAILWHGGEADFSKTLFVNLPKEKRVALLRFLKSL